MTEFVTVAQTGEVPEGKMKTVQVQGQPACLVNLAGSYHAVGNVCTHMRCPLSAGQLNGSLITCPCHGSQFDIKTGEVKRGPAVSPEPVYEVKIEGTNILLRKQ